MAHIDHAVAEHEAAHIVVGLALGLRLRRAVVGPCEWRGWAALGYTWFAVGPRKRLAAGIMSCAGIAWEARPSGDAQGAAGDRILAREWLTSLHDVAVGTRIAAEILRGRRAIHARLAAELTDGALGPRDIARLCAGE